MNDRWKTPEELQYEKLSDIIADNARSSVKIIRNSKGITWEIKVYHEDPHKALEISEEIHKKLMEKYGGQ